MFSCLYNDLGIYNPELQRFTYESYATTWLALVYIAFNFGYWLNIGRQLNSNFPKYNNFFTREVFLEKFTKIFFFLLSIYVLLELVQYGVPVLHGIDRLEIQKHKNEIEINVENYFIFFVFMLGLLRSNSKKIVWNDVHFLLYIFYFIANGHKFSGLIDLILIYSVPSWILLCCNSAHVDKTKRLKVILTLFAVVVGLVAVVYMHYLNITGSASGAIDEFFVRFFALQGHVWWTVFNDINLYGLYDAMHWQSELSAIIDSHNTSPDAYGMRYLMIGVIYIRGRIRRL